MQYHAVGGNLTKKENLDIDTDNVLSTVFTFMYFFL